MQIDFTYLETVSDGDPEFISQFISTFEETYTSLTAKMESELEAGDMENLGRTAHQLKPSAKMIGLESGAKLEELQDNPQLADKETLSKIKEDCKQGLAEMVTWAKDQGITLD